MVRMEQLGHSITYIKQMYTLWAKNEGLDNVHVLWILCSLLRHPHRSQQEICTDFFIPKQTLSPICKNLLKEGIIEPTAVCLDKREKRIQLTEKGRAFAEPMMARLNMLENKVFTRLGEEKSEVLITLTRQLSEFLGEEILSDIDAAK